MYLEIPHNFSNNIFFKTFRNDPFIKSLHIKYLSIPNSPVRILYMLMICFLNIVTDVTAYRGHNLVWRSILSSPSH